jgi:hypothetical protein
MKNTAGSNVDDLLRSLSNQVVSSSTMVSRFGARLVVQYKFIDAVLAQLDAAQRLQVTRLFQHGVEGAMAYTDDIAMPAEYHVALLEETNLLLTALGSQ